MELNLNYFIFSRVSICENWRKKAHMLNLFSNKSNYARSSWKTTQNVVAGIFHTNNPIIIPFHVISLFLFLLKTWENQKFSDVSRGYKKRPVAWNGLRQITCFHELNEAPLNTAKREKHSWRSVTFSKVAGFSL